MYFLLPVLFVAAFCNTNKYYISKSLTKINAPVMPVAAICSANKYINKLCKLR